MSNFITNNLCICFISSLGVGIYSLLNKPHTGSLKTISRLQTMLYTYGLHHEILAIFYTLVCTNITFIIMLIMSSFSIYSFIIVTCIISVVHALYVGKNYHFNNKSVMILIMLWRFISIGVIFVTTNYNLPILAIVYMVIEIPVWIGINKLLYRYGNRIKGGIS
ncbi:MAG: hypothetical protein ACK5LC_07280 [Coprobacillaceae bacterium]